MDVSIDSPYSPDECRRRLAKTFQGKLPRWWPAQPVFLAGERRFRGSIRGDLVRAAFIGSFERYGGPKPFKFAFEGRLIAAGSGSRLVGRISYPPPLEAALYGAIGAVMGVGFWIGTGIVILVPLLIIWMLVAWFGQQWWNRTTRDGAESDINAIFDRLNGALQPDPGSTEDPMAESRLRWGG